VSAYKYTGVGDHMQPRAVVDASRRAASSSTSQQPL
jgi:hypothetical protein